MLKASLVLSLLLALPAAPAASEPDSGAVSGAAVAADSLLPSTLGPMERILWSERGLIRRIAMPLTEESREKEVHLRRSLLTAHQAGGFLTLGLMTATAITGQQILNGRDDLGGRKEILVAGTVLSYFTTALLALAAPPPMVRRKQWNSISWHKALAVVHFTGMIATPILGRSMEDDEDRQRLHQYTGYATLAAFAGAMVVVTF
jgi:hypothetical protein